MTTVAAKPEGVGTPPRRRGKSVLRHWQLYSLLVLPLIYFLVFRYVPMIGNVIAFRQYIPGGSIFGESWVGFQNFTLFLTDPNFWTVFRNTVMLGGLTLVFGFPVPLVLALLMNELRTRWFKRFVQTTTYLPHFLSVVIVAGMVFQLTSLHGSINELLSAVGLQKISFMQEPGWFPAIYVGSEIWQTAGWGTILYLAALTTIDENLYEAARIDGANRWQQTWHVTLPGILPTVMTLLILNIGTFMAVGFEKILLLYNPVTYSTADVISTYLYRVGIQAGSFSYAAAIGMFEALIGVILVVGANLVSKRVVGSSLW
ncbi:ABC transporter permease [Gryllotalpicola ginsengisoli]|uniref:ABC transporter permease n=1 Tax=Gryllotalpicola ginsengisoli TaxID=444608 RepID=UPI0003B7745D|nr:ABC transporter permease subunit [Gryllotalpicola ginsengisoli]